MRPCDEICKLIEKYAIEFDENEMKWYQPEMVSDTENKYIMYMMEKNHNIKFSCMKELKVVRYYLGV